MTAVPPASTEAQLGPLFKWPTLSWPDGTGWFAFRTWVALAIALYAAFFFELDGASSAGVCVLILAQPSQGMVLSKSIYRLAGTLAGVGAALTISSLFPQDRVMLVASFAVWMGLLTAIGTVLRDFRAYGCILAGYTVAIISIANVDAPSAAFSAAVNRVAAIIVGIAAIGLTNAVLATAESSQSLLFKLRVRTSEVIAMASCMLDRRATLDPSESVAMSAKLMPLRSEISFATPELPDGRARARGARSALGGLFELITAMNAVGAGLRGITVPSALIDKAVLIARRALRLQNPEKCLRELEALALPAISAGALSIDEAFVLDRMHFMIEGLGAVRDGLRSVRYGWEPRRISRLPAHQDYVAVVLNAVRVVAAIAAVALLSIWSGLPDTAQALLFTAVFVSLGSILPNPMVMGKAALFGMPAVVIVAAIYDFFVLPALDGFPLFIIALAPVVVAMCWLIRLGLPGVGLIFGVQTLVLIGPANVQTLDPPTFVGTATMLALSGATIFLSFLLILPVDPAQRRLRLALAVGRNLRRALADKGKLSQPRASLYYDRLSQFKTWQRDETVTLARRKTVKRLIDIGHLAYAVRRTWRSLDRSCPLVDPALDARARTILPALSPEETQKLALVYLAEAKGKEGRSALDLVHAAAALHGTALVTTSEMRLLKHVELLRRKL